MSRYFIENSQLSGNRITIVGEDYQHLKKVLRAERGDLITVCCDGFDYLAKLEELGSNSILAEVISKQKNVTESKLRVTLYQGLPKADKMELIVQKCVELGVAEIVPVITERSIVKINTEKDAHNKVSRWQKISMEAAKQCNRGIVPKVVMPIKFSEAVFSAVEKELSIIPYEKESTTGFNSIIKEFSNVATAAIFIGPEGGFSENEIQLAEDKGVKSITLGPRILRTETAGMVALTLMMYELGDVSNGRA